LERGVCGPVDPLGRELRDVDEAFDALLDLLEDGADGSVIDGDTIQIGRTTMILEFITKCDECDSIIQKEDREASQWLENKMLCSQCRKMLRASS
jgi:hypothetical protein